MVIKQEFQPNLSRLDTPWKRAAFILFTLATIILGGMIVFPSPVRVETDARWIDGLIQGQKIRTVQRITFSCVQSDLGYKSFDSELEILRASSNGYYAALFMAQNKSFRVRTESTDINEEETRQFREILARQAPICFQGSCIQELTHQFLEVIIKSCSTPTIQSLKTESQLRLDLSHLKDREELLLVTVLIMVISLLFSIFYSVTVGRLLLWVRNG